MKIEQLEIVFISTIRPELANLTLKSFRHFFFRQVDQVRLIANIDPAGDPNYVQKDVIRVLSKYSNNLIVRTPESANFSQAVKWGWEQVTTPFFLHLEDDWFLGKKVCYDKILSEFQGDANLGAVRLNLSRNPRNKDMNSDGFSLNPSIFRTELIKELLKQFDIKKDPEKQFRNNYTTTAINFHTKYYGASGEGAFVTDTGKKWRKANNYGKWNNEDSKIIWSREPNTSKLQKNFYKFKYNFFIKLWLTRVLISKLFSFFCN